MGGCDSGEGLARRIGSAGPPRSTLRLCSGLRRPHLLDRVSGLTSSAEGDGVEFRYIRDSRRENAEGRESGPGF